MSRSYNPVPNPGPVDEPFEMAPRATTPFAGAALNDGDSSARASLSDASRALTNFDDYSSSVRALNPGVGPDDTDPSFYGLHYRDDPADGTSSPAEGAAATKELGSPTSPYLAAGVPAGEKSMPPGMRYAGTRSRRRRALLIVGALAFAIIVVVVVCAVYFSVKNHDNKSTSSDVSSAQPSSSSSSSTGSSSSGSSGSKSSGSSSSLAVTGGDGSTVTMADGTTFTYVNSFGGYWYYDPKEPLSNYARAQSWTPALNETFEYGTDQIRGVNLGGWLVTEPFIAPSLFEPYVNTSYPAVDEWTLSYNLMNETSQGGLEGILTNHYETFVTEQDFAEIAGAGLNFVRIPLPYWAIETWEGEPFLAKVSWTYFLKAIEWARKYGLRINLDFHCLPGSQNGWNHSGKLGSINVLNGPMGFANTQRSLSYIKIIAEFISQPEYSAIVPIFGVTNEPLGPTIGQDNLAAYYVQVYDIIRLASGIGEGNGPYVLYHDGFFALSSWVGFLTGGDRMGLDDHPYVCFEGQSATPYSGRLTVPCDTWGGMMNSSLSSFGLTTAGEWSNAINDCGLWVNGVGDGSRYEGTFAGFAKTGDCTEWVDWQNWNETFKESITGWALASMSSLQNWFFWTWKIGNSTVSGTVEAPQWSYQLGLQNGWMPSDPREASGVCSPSAVFTGLSAWQTGGSGAGSTSASAATAYPWPPTVMSNAGFSATEVSLLPSYTATGSMVTLPAPTFTDGSGTVSVSVGDGWANPSGTAQKYVAIETCNYLFPWVGPTNPPSPLCGGSASSAAKRAYPTPAPTPS